MLPRARALAVFENPDPSLHNQRRSPMADVNAMRKTVLDYVKAEYLDDDDGTELGADSPLISAGIVDSFSMVSLKTFLERKYKISIPDDKATPEAFDSVNKIVKLLEEYIK
jgi:acyl carrier protein